MRWPAAGCCFADVARDPHHGGSFVRDLSGEGRHLIVVVVVILRADEDGALVLLGAGLAPLAAVGNGEAAVVRHAVKGVLLARAGLAGVRGALLAELLGAL